MTHVFLHGALATAVGKAEWRVDISTPVEAVSAIDANSDGRLMNHLYENLDTEYRVVIDNQDLGAIKEFMVLERPMKEVHIMPVIRGAGSAGTWLLIAGLVIIAAVLTIVSLGAAAPGLAGAISAIGGMGGVASFFLTVGIAVTLAGISQLTAPKNAIDNKEKPENQPSYIFNGAVNTYQQGNPIPTGFGFTRIGSQVISAGVRSADISVEDDPLSYSISIG